MINKVTTATIDGAGMGSEIEQYLADMTPTARYTIIISDSGDNGHIADAFDVATQEEVAEEVRSSQADDLSVVDVVTDDEIGAPCRIDIIDHVADTIETIMDWTIDTEDTERAIAERDDE
jgi:hypothetical protein